MPFGDQILHFWYTIFVDSDLTLSLHSLHFTTLYYAFFATLCYTLVHFLHFTTLFYDQMLHFQYAILVDSDLHPLVHLVHFCYTHYALLRFTTLFWLHLATLWYISYTFRTLSVTKSLRFWYTIFVDSDLSLDYILSDVDVSQY